MLGIREWTTETWTAIAAIVAFAALIQPWFIAGWRRVFKRGALDIHETPLAEIGFSALGATIGLLGTFRARDRDMFIQAAKLILVKRKDSSFREFDWFAFRVPKVSVGTAVGQSTEVAMDVPFSFMISTLEPHRFNILFSDTALLQEARPMVESLRKEWLVRVQDIEVPELPMDSNAQRSLTKKLRRAHREFSENPSYQDTLEFLNQLYYWEAGAYDLTLQIQTARPNRSYKKQRSFSLSEGEVASLRNNVPFALEEALGLPLMPSVYTFILTPLREPNSL